MAGVQATNTAVCSTCGEPLNGRSGCLACQLRAGLLEALESNAPGKSYSVADTRKVSNDNASVGLLDQMRGKSKYDPKDVEGDTLPSKAEENRPDQQQPSKDDSNTGDVVDVLENIQEMLSQLAGKVAVAP